MGRFGAPGVRVADGGGVPEPVASGLDGPHSVVRSADGRLLVVKTDGEVLLVRPDAARLVVLARARPFADDPRGGPARALPALAGGRLYLRNDRSLVALDVGR